MKVARSYRDHRDLVALSGCASLYVMMEQTASLTFSPTASLCLATGPVAQTIHLAEGLYVMMEQTASLTFSPTASLCLATGPVAQTIHLAEVPRTLKVRESGPSSPRTADLDP
ncbi:uncharacterized protein LOC134763806 [Penaeus indicus]|uniref:uncharacterized protein LOC134763806 n=1 Tax=Penaeus indicus TaxID=29960 RepID=UPI00300D953F